MARAHIAGATGIVVGATAIAVLIGYLGGRLGAAPDQRIAVSEDTYADTADPQRAGGDRAELVAGGMGGGAAITYLKFTVSGLRGGKPPARAEVRLTRRAGVLPGHIELTRVPATGWREATLAARSAPPLGSVVASARPKGYDDRVVFDVSRVIRRAGTYSFAVTAPAGDGHATFFASEGAPPSAGLVRPTLWLSWAGRPASAQTPTPPTPSGTAPPTFPTLPTLPTMPTPPTPPALPTPPTIGPASQSPAPPTPTTPVSESPTPTPIATPSGTAPPDNPDPNCVTGDLLVPSCGVLWGVAPGAHSSTPRHVALDEFEEKTGRKQVIYHAYHRGTEIFPTEKERQIARDRLLFLNWKPQGATWAEIAQGDPDTEAYLDRLADHIKSTFGEPFFFSVHHEPENDVDPRAGSGFTAEDYAAMYRHAILGLRARGVTNLVSTMVYMAYVPLNAEPWFESLYPGDDVVDWVGWDAYAHSEPGEYGFGDFAEMMNRRSSSRPSWPGFYNWAAERHPDKPLMVSEWGVWHASGNPSHRAHFYGTVGRQMPLFPRVKAMVYFDTPRDQRGRDSRVDRTPDGLAAYRTLGQERMFQVRLSQIRLSQMRITPAGVAAPPSQSP